MKTNRLKAFLVAAAIALSPIAASSPASALSGGSLPTVCLHHEPCGFCTDSPLLGLIATETAYCVYL
jgi:hypothetical protein